MGGNVSVATPNGAGRVWGGGRSETPLPPAGVLGGGAPYNKFSGLHRPLH